MAEGSFKKHRNFKRIPPQVFMTFRAFLARVHSTENLLKNFRKSDRTNSERS